MDVTVDAAQVRQRRARQRQKLKADRQEGFANDVQVRGRQQVVDVGDAAGDGVFDGDHRQIGGAVAQGGESILESRAGQRLALREIFDAGDVRIRAGFALVGDFHIGLLRRRRAASRSWGVSTPSGATSTKAMSIRIPASSARNCSSRSRSSKAEGGSATKVSSAFRV